MFYVRINGGFISFYSLLILNIKNGIGRKLFQYVLSECTSSNITVNASPYAISVYHKLGFADTDTE
ncbi:MAG: GNAT family N-acetyltransferase [Lachnospiraceae bacterium]|nr:GNAT family N-acetyltransferase [Lachnospiraceae bacterium]